MQSSSGLKTLFWFCLSLEIVTDTESIYLLPDLAIGYSALL
jgi:hypothetical protein